MENLGKHIPQGHNKNVFLILAVVLIALFAILTVSGAVDISNKIKQGKYIGQEIETKNTISVSGKGEVYTQPDLAIIVFSVETEKTTVAKAMEENTEKMNDIIEAMKSLSIEEKDLKTIDFNISPRYEYRDYNIYPSTGRRVLVGYEVTQSLQVKIRDLEKIGQAIQEATDLGSNQVGNLQFTVDKQDEFKDQAREEAIGQAKEKAEKIASQLGVNLARITSFSESSQLPYYYRSDLVAEGIGAGASAPQIEVGQSKIEVNVTLTYEIN